MARTDFDDLPTLSASPPASPHRSRRSWARMIERCCCQTLQYFPLCFVYGLTTWAIWVEVGVSFLGLGGVATTGAWFPYLKAGLGLALYALLNWSYTTAVFTNPGSPLDERLGLAQKTGSTGGRKNGGYEGLPSYEDEGIEGSQELPHGMTTVTAKSTGKPRFCKKCRCVKPDRTHHCSTCGKCVLKMDHHCPWLATCVGLRNYKAFILFLTYTSLFCWLCFAVSAAWVWAELMDETQMQEGLRVVNTILLAVLGGIIGLVLSGFTGWHIYLAVTAQTTIESLEKTRYLSPLRRSMEHQLQNRSQHRHYLSQDQNSNTHELSGSAGLLLNNDGQSLTDRVKEIHANALPGVLRPEEGEDSRDVSRAHTPVVPTGFSESESPARASLHRSFASLEEQRERERYEAYLDEQDSETLPNAFDLGWKRNLKHVFGENPLFWGVPVCNTSGDGWAWDLSETWSEARAELTRQKAQRQRERDAWDAQPGSFEPPRPQRDLKWTPGRGFVDRAKNVAPTQVHARASSAADVRAQMQMQPLDRRKADDDGETDYDTSSSDDEVKRMYSHVGFQGHAGPTANWNDVPDEFLGPPRSRTARRKGD